MFVKPMPRSTFRVSQDTTRRARRENALLIIDRRFTLLEIFISKPIFLLENWFFLVLIEVFIGKKEENVEKNIFGNLWCRDNLRSHI